MRIPGNYATRRASLGLVVLLLCLVAVCNRDPFANLPRTLPPMVVYFSPEGGCTEAVVREIDAAQTSILVQAYSFTSTPIARALVEAHQRGVRIEVILDRSQESEKYSSADFVIHAGIPTMIDAKHAIAHNKVIIIDDGIVITGSFNFTKAAEEHNAENLLVIRDQQIAEKYTANWHLHAAHSERYSRRTP